RVVNLDGAVRVDSLIAVQGSRSLEGIELRLTATLHAGTTTKLGAHQTVSSFIFRAGFVVGPRGARLTATFKKVALPRWRRRR
ncbi:hypothetical protein, partial [Pseudomonas aeruginosa]|uniref:hypothetical protein n=1 Tax=Pseudomonas aeruginosa TaxID=287 RepID=UPI003CC62EB3